MNELKELRTEIRKIYREKQAECGLKIGDTVLVTKQATSFKHGWDSNWDIAMDSSVGNFYQILKIHDWGIKLSNGFSYPYYVLRKKVDNKTYHVSQRFLHNSNEYLLASVGNNRVNLINIETGCRLSVHGLIVNNTRKITEKEIIELVDEYYSMWNEFVLVE